jgi:hypothetical protein
MGNRVSVGGREGGREGRPRRPHLCSLMQRRKLDAVIPCAQSLMRLTLHSTVTHNSIGSPHTSRGGGGGGGGGPPPPAAREHTCTLSR